MQLLVIGHQMSLTILDDARKNVEIRLIYHNACVKKVDGLKNTLRYQLDGADGLDWLEL